MVAALEHGGVVQRGYLGVQIQPVSQDIADGARPEGRQRRAGRPDAAGNARGRGRPEVGDVITKLNGRRSRTRRISPGMSAR